VVRAEGSCPRGCGFESRRILDGCKHQENIKKIQCIYIIKEFVQPKMSLNKEFINWKEQGRGVRERERERERERVGGGSAGSHI
jgi:hypothetical protein